MMRMTNHQHTLILIYQKREYIHFHQLANDLYFENKPGCTINNFVEKNYQEFNQQ